MQRIISIFLIVVVILTIAGCNVRTDNNYSQSYPTYGTTTVQQSLKVYPLNVDREYANYAVSIPQIIYEATAEVNGLVGNIYTFEGVVSKIDTYQDTPSGYECEYAFVEIEDKTVIVINMYAAIYNAVLAVYGKDVTNLIYTDNLDNYILPKEGEVARFITIYNGYSEGKKMPVFYLGASSTFFSMIGYYDPVVSKNAGPLPSESTPPPTEPSVTEPPYTEPIETTRPETEPHISTGQKNALRTAANYLGFTAFSYKGLIDQLKYEGYTSSEATYAADNCGADWFEQALKCAKRYLDYSAFSYSGLVDQLKYEEFTSAQAKYAADNCGADWYEQASKCAKKYLDFMDFSRQGLIEQLEYEGFTHGQAVYGAEQNGL